MKEVVIYTDGACRGNPGPGGWGALLEYGKHRKELSGGFARTTNNRMEILAAIQGLETLKEPCTVTLYSDSKYLVQAIDERWLHNWKRNGWRTAAKKPVKNQDLWERLDEQLARHKVQFKWVKGHATNPGNNRCDELATTAADQPDLPEDSGWEE